MNRDIIRSLRLLIQPTVFKSYKVIFSLFQLLPVKKTKVVATTMRGRKFSDNPMFIMEALHRMDSSLDLVWFVDERYEYETPEWIRRVPYYGSGMLKRIYEMATAKVWINSHFNEIFVKKKKNQFFIQTWHGSIPMKKINMDIQGWDAHSESAQELIKTVEMTDVFISNSGFTNELYRKAFGYKGEILKCGSPRNDVMIRSSSQTREQVRAELGIGEKKNFLYAPTFRDEFEKTHNVDFSVYDVDFEGVYKALKEYDGGDWIILVKFHPIMQRYIDEKEYFHNSFVKNVTSYNNMQMLLAASDMVLTDYSSLIFDSAIAGVPGMTICLDYQQYKGQRDLYFDMKELPFPFADTNARLIENIRNFDKEKYDRNWKEYSEKLGVYESGQSAKKIATMILQRINNDKQISN